MTFFTVQKWCSGLCSLLQLLGNSQYIYIYILYTHVLPTQKRLNYNTQIIINQSYIKLLNARPAVMNQAVSSETRTSSSQSESHFCIVNSGLVENHHEGSISIMPGVGHKLGNFHDFTALLSIEVLQLEHTRGPKLHIHTSHYVCHLIA